MTTPSGTTPTRFEKRTFGVLLAVAGAFFLWTVSPIWVPVFLGVLLAVVASPLQRRLERRYRQAIRVCWPRRSASSPSALGLGLVVFMGYFVVKELLLYLTDVGAAARGGGGAAGCTRRACRACLHRLGQSPDGVMKQAQAYGHAAVTHLSDVVGGVCSPRRRTWRSSSSSRPSRRITSCSKGRRWRASSCAWCRCRSEETRALMHEFHEVAIGTLLGIGVIALVQGVLGGARLLDLRHRQADRVGRAVRDRVAGAGDRHRHRLRAGGHGLRADRPRRRRRGAARRTGASSITSMPDYWLRPRLMKGHMRLHELLVLIAVFGGIEAFGAIGLHHRARCSWRCSWRCCASTSATTARPRRGRLRAGNLLDEGGGAVALAAEVDGAVVVA